MLIRAFVTSRTAAADMVARALRCAFEVRVIDCSGFQEGYLVEFDEYSMSADELAQVLSGAEYRQLENA
jgi:hypothetical protein